VQQTALLVARSLCLLHIGRRQPPKEIFRAEFSARAYISAAAGPAQIAPTLLAQTKSFANRLLRKVREKATLAAGLPLISIAEVNRNHAPSHN
jgi:hypothetical protein